MAVLLSLGCSAAGNPVQQGELLCLQQATWSRESTRSAREFQPASATLERALTRVLRVIADQMSARVDIGAQLVFGPVLWRYLSCAGTPILGQTMPVEWGYERPVRVLGACAFETDHNVRSLFDMPTIRDLASHFSRGQVVATTRQQRQYMKIQARARFDSAAVAGVQTPSGTILLAMFVGARLVWLDLWKPIGDYVV